MKLFHRFRSNEHGGIAMIVGLALPVLVGSAAAALEYANLASRRTALQKAADTAALAAARELAVAVADDVRIVSVAKAVALAALANGKDAGTSARVEAQVLDQRSVVAVEVTETVASLMGKVMALPTTELHGRATARRMGSTKICVIGLETASNDTIRLDSNAKLTANGCAIYSNSSSSRGVRSESNAVVSSTQLICSSGGFVGGTSNYSGKRRTDCPITPDPMESRPKPIVDNFCNYTNKKIEADGTYTLNPGTYCKGLFIGASAKVTFNPGLYVMKDGRLHLDSNAEVKGTHVGFYFSGENAYFQFTSNAKVSLSAPRDGAMAGILFYGDPNAETTRRYTITSNYANNLVGTIYIPQGDFVVDASNPVADQSAWTAVVVRRLQLFAQPNLVLNSNYDQTDVPVPQGLAPSGSGVTLVK
jgi:Flp pilus assembly protein TadG